jgi:lysozyme
MPTYQSFDGKPVSRAWYAFLLAARNSGVDFHLNSGHRTMREQWALYRQNMVRPGVPKPGRPLTAFPSPTAPHIRIGRLDHAIDVRDENLFAEGGGFERLQDWGARNGVWINRTVPSEAWHGEASARALSEFYARAMRRKREQRRRDRVRELVRRLGKRRVSREAVQLVAEFEGGMSPDGRFRPYQDPVGVWTQGYGHTKGVHLGARPWSKRKAMRVLRRDLNHEYAPHVRRLNLPLNQSQFDALVSFVFNLGPGAIGRDTGIGRALRHHAWRGAAEQMLRWNKAGGKELPGLTRRRKAERTLFLSGREAKRP